MNQISKTKNLESLEKQMLSMPQVPCGVTHRFGPGVYMREVQLPKGAIVIGHHHNFEHMNVFLKGRITFFNDEGKPVELVAPMTFVAKPGRKVAFIHEDSIWVNVYPTTETDVEKLEAHYLTKSDSWVNDNNYRNQILLVQGNVDKKDYLEAIGSFGFTEEGVRRISENKDDMIDLPSGSYKIKTGKSAIEGTGLFATSDIFQNEIIAPVRINGKRTIVERYTNHSASQNSEMVKFGNGDIALIATRKISGCHGGQDGEEITVNYRQALNLNLEIGEKKCQQSQQQ